MGFIEDIVSQHYGYKVIESDKLTVGAGSNTYSILTDHGRFILKNANINEANNPQNEPALCEFLLAHEIPVSEFIKDVDGSYTWTHNGGLYHMQKFVDGINLKWHMVPNWLLHDAAKLLGQIHTVLQDYPPLPTGIGDNFFKYMTPVSVMKSYKDSLDYAKQINDMQSIEDLVYRMELINRINIPKINLDKLTRKNTHGDYFISQVLCGEKKINAIIDWTTACIHPVVWEVIRFYIYAAPECCTGEINIDKFIPYAAQYLNNAELTEYDLYMMPYIFFYQILVCDYYGQFYKSDADNSKIYLQQAILSTRLMKWLEKNIADLSNALRTLV